MRQDEELWMKKMKEMLSEYSEPVPARGWEALEKKLTHAPKQTYVLKWWAASAAALLLAVSAVSLFFLNSDVAEEMRNFPVADIVVTPDDVPDQPRIDVLKIVSEPIQKDRIVQIESAQTVSAVPVEHLIETESKAIEPIIEIGGETERGDQKELINVEKTENRAEKEQIAEAENKTIRPSGKDKLHLPAERSKSISSSKGWKLALNVNSGALTSSMLTNSSNMDMNGSASLMPEMSYDMLEAGAINIPSDQVLLFKDGKPYLVKTKDITDVKHHQPITVGVSVRKDLKNNFSVETGVMYTLLSSDVKIAGNEMKELEQKLHYIGVPLKANWEFLNSRRFGMYVSGGGAIEKCVYGKTGSQKNTVDELQFSLMGAVGAEYKANDKVGLYVEPGVAYYFDDGSNVETIRKDKQFNINLQAGIRFTY